MQYNEIGIQGANSLLPQARNSAGYKPKKFWSFYKMFLGLGKPSACLFDQRFNGTGIDADRQQWNGARHLNAAELQVAKCNEPVNKG